MCQDGGGGYPGAPICSEEKGRGEIMRGRNQEGGSEWDVKGIFKSSF